MIERPTSHVTLAATKILCVIHLVVNQVIYVTQR